MTRWDYRPPVDLGVLGPLRVRIDGAELVVPGAKERTLLARLVAGAGRTVTTEDLVHALWGEDPPRSAGKSLQTFVLRLRNLLEPDRGGASQVLVTEPSGYRLAVPADAVDAHRFAQLVEAGRRALQEGRPEEARRTLTSGLSLWRGPAYAGCEHTAFGAREAARLDELRLVAVEDRAAATVDLGGAAAAVPDLERLVAEHPFRERAWALLVTALYRSDRQSDALAAYDRVRALLADELGVDPGPALQALHARVLAQDPALRPVPAGRAGGAVPDTLRRAAASAGPLAAVPEPPLQQALDALVPLAAAGGSAVLVGPPGSGRHRVALALAEEVARGGGDVRHVLPGTAGTAGAAVLVVVDVGGEPPTAGPDGFVLRLADVAPASSGPAVVHVPPLGRDDVRRLLAAHAADDSSGQPDLVDEATVARALGDTGGRADDVHRWAAEWSRRLVSARVRRAAGHAEASTSSLQRAREELREGVETLRSASVREAVGDPGRCPWPGLLAYDVQDADRFAGRERLVAECVARLAAPGVLGVVGASGSGKSSLVRAGVLAALADGALPGSESWPRLLMRPGAHPMVELTRAAIGAAARPVGVDDLVGRLLDGDGAGTRTLLVVDQAEELWTTCTDPGERAAFLDALAGLVTRPTAAGADETGPAGAVSVVLVVRADYVAELTTRPALAAAVADCAVLVGPPSQHEVRRAVELPAARAGLELDVGLVDALAEDAGEEPGVLPMLSTALQGLWEQRQGPHLTLAAYVAAGALSGAVARLAERTYQGLDASQQETARVLLTRLAGPGEGDAVTRRRVPLGELAALARPDLDEVVRRLVAARLCTVGGGHVEVAHEALFREWPRLRGWLAEDVGAQQVLRRLTTAATEWDEDGRDPALLWRGARLQAATDAVEQHGDLVTAVERDFVTASTDAIERDRRDAEQQAVQAQRSNRRLRGLLSGLALLLVVALAAGAFAVVQAGRAADARVAADAKRLAAGAVNEDYHDLALLSAVEAVRSEQAPETYGALLTLLSQAPELVTTLRSPDRFLLADVSPDGDTVYLGENVARVRAVAADGTPLWTAATVGQQPLTMLATPDGAGLVVADVDDGVVLRLLDAATGEEGWRLGPDELQEEWVGPEMAWLPGGELVLGGGDDLVVVDTGSRSVARRIPWPEDGPVGWIVSLSDGRLLVHADGPPSDGGEHVQQLVDTRSGEVTPTTLVGRVLDVSDDGSRLLLARPLDGDVATELTVVATDDLQPLETTVRVTGVIRSAAFSPDGSVLAVASDEAVTLHDGTTGVPTGQVLAAHSGRVMQMQFAGDGSRLWTAGRDGAAMLWDLTASTGLADRSDADVFGYRAGVSADGTVAVVNRWHDDRFNEARLADPRTGEDLLGEQLPVPDGCVCQVWAVAMTSDGGTALGAVNVFGGTVEEPEPPWREDLGHLLVWDTDDGSVRSAVDLPWPPQGVDVTADGRWAVVNGTTGWAVVDLTTEQVVATDDEGGRADVVVDTEVTGTVAVAPDGSRAAVLRNSRVVLVDLPAGQPVIERVVAEDDSLWTAEWTPDGDTLVVGGFAGAVHVLDGSTLQPRVPERLVNAGWVLSLQVDPTGRLLASLGTDGDVLLWDTTTWQPLGTPLVDDGGWGWLQFSPRGDRLVASYEDGAVLTWPTDPEEWVGHACRVAGRDLTASEWQTVRPGVPWRSTCGYSDAG
jgi:DNA-binding SARP family transcriptional activator/WD40 repeat protein